MKYVFRGNAPQEEDDDGTLRILRPLDVREFDDDPGYPWELVPVGEPDEAEPPAKAPAEPPLVITPDGPRPAVSEGA